MTEQKDNFCILCNVEGHSNNECPVYMTGKYGISFPESTTIEQIAYYDWGDELKPEHKDYWHIISDIAHLIALDLESYRCPIITNVEYYKFSTIQVTDYKEKFGCPRVYCTFGCHEQCKRQYEEYKKGEKYDGISFEEYQKLCIKDDLQHYRDVYLKFKRLLPQYWKVIKSGASYSEYLFETKEELEEYYGNQPKDEFKKFLYYVPNDEERKNIYEICGFVL